MPPKSPTPDPNAERTQALEHIEAALRGLQFGEVTIVVQDGVVVQIERTERMRLPRSLKKG